MKVTLKAVLVGLLTLVLGIALVFYVGRSGDSERVVFASSEQDPKEMPAMINAWFLCSDMNADPEAGSWRGHVILRGVKYSCRELDKKSSRYGPTTMQPGESMTILIPVRK